MAVIGYLGNDADDGVQFSVSHEVFRTPNNMKWSGSARYSTHARHATHALTEFTGLDPDAFQFIPTDPDDIVIWLTDSYEKIMGVTVRPASPERNFIQWMASAIVLERVLTNYAANQNIPSRAVGDNLDALAELFYARERPRAKAAATTMRFTVSGPLSFAVLIPKGTRVTDAGKTLVWETLADAYVPAGESHADIKVRCQTPGKEGG